VHGDRIQLDVINPKREKSGVYKVVMKNAQGQVTILFIFLLPNIFLWAQCYDHNFLRFSTIFCEKIGVFLKKQCYDQNFA
jgi:hypothetical protein